MNKYNIKTARVLAEILVLGSLFLGVTNVAFATTAAVSATVRLQNIQVVVTPGTVNYGVLGLASSMDTVATSGSGHLYPTATSTQTAINNGNISEDLAIIGQSGTTASSTCTTVGSPYLWRISSTSTGIDAFTHQFSTSTTGINWNFIGGGGYTPLKSALGASSTQSFDLKINTPTASTCYDPQSVNVTVQASCAVGVSC